MASKKKTAAKKTAEKKPQSGKAKKVFVANNGKRYDVISESGKYYICEGTQFKKWSTLGHVEEVSASVTEAEKVDDE